MRNYTDSYITKVEEAKNECLERMKDEVTNLKYDSTEQKIAEIVLHELNYNLNDISDPQGYFTNLTSIFSTLEGIMNEYHEKLDEIEEEEG